MHKDEKVMCRSLTFCGLAYARLDRKTEAQAMLTEFEKKAGSAYDVPDCHDMLTVLRHWVSN
jgi:hypothetical protein